MFSPKQQQLEICLLNSNLEEITNDLVKQESLLPTLMAENEKRYEATVSVLSTVHTLSKELERLKHKNIGLTARRVQLKLQCENLNKEVEAARCKRNSLMNSLNQEKQEMNHQMNQRNDSLQVKANRFRTSHEYYNEEKVKIEIDTLHSAIFELENQLSPQQGIVDDLKRQIDAIRPTVPEDILTIMGSSNLDDKIKELNDKHDALVEKRNVLLNQKSDDVKLGMKKF